jgi:acetyl-CoA acyltransferase
VKQVYVAGVGSTHFGKFPERRLRELVAEAVAGALRDAGVEAAAVEAVFFGNAAAGLLTGQEMIRGQVELQHTGIEGVPVFNVENACASASSALHLACQAVAAGQYQIVLAVGAEKMSGLPKEGVFRALTAALDVESLEDIESTIEVRSPFMDVYADMTQRYQARSAAAPMDFALIAQKNHRNGSANPIAQYGDDLSVEAILASRPIAGPLTLYMCSGIGDGASAAIVCSGEVVGSLPKRGVRVAASVVLTGLPGARDGGAVVRAAQKAYQAAGIKAGDVDVVEVHDAVAPAELMACEELGLADEGQAPALLRSGATQIGGRVPVNPSGGLLARGHPIGATGLAQIYELVLQLRGEAGSRQVSGAQVALAQNGGGYLNGDIGAEAVHILTA